MIDLFLLLQTEAKAHEEELAMQERSIVMESRLEEFMIDARRRKPMTPAQMANFYGKNGNNRPSINVRVRTTIGEALIGMGERLKPDNPMPTMKPAYQSHGSSG